MNGEETPKTAVKQDLDLIYTRKFWLRIGQRIGKAYERRWCSDWSWRAFHIVGWGEHTKGRFYLRAVMLPDELVTAERTGHTWLESNEFGVGDDTYIADGTAGQFDDSFGDGYYGFLGKAPDSLQQIYRRKTILLYPYNRNNLSVLK